MYLAGRCHEHLAADHAAGEDVHSSGGGGGPGEEQAALQDVGHGCCVHGELQQGRGRLDQP